MENCDKNNPTDNIETTESNNSKSKLLHWMETRLFPVLSKINELRFLQAIRESVFSSIPFLILGFLTLFFVINKDGTAAKRALDSFSGMLGLLGAWLSFYLPFAVNKDEMSKFSAITTGLLSLVLFIISFPPLEADKKVISDFLKLLSKGGIIVAIVLAGLFLLIERKLSPLFNRKESDELEKSEDKLRSKNPFKAVYPSIIAAFLILLVPFLLIRLKNINIYTWAEIMMKPLVAAGDTLPAAMIIVFLMSLFYLFGIHGTGVVGGAVLPFYLVLYNENVAAHAAGQPMPHIITPSFFIWSMIGGTGATLPLCVYMLTSKVKKFRDVAKVSILPSFANINEPLIFGVPLIMNPIIAIPFLFTPVIIAVINYAAIYYNLAGRIFILAPFVIPQPFHAYACTLDIRNIILLLVDILVAFVIYFPFYRMLEREECSTKGVKD